MNVRNFSGYLFTGKLIKSVLIRACPRLEDAFKPSKGPEPKLVHISPLYHVEEGKIRCLYSYALCKSSGVLIKCEGRPKPVVLDGNYYFYLGFHESVTSLSAMLDALLNYRECFEFMDQRVCVDVREVHVYDPYTVSLDLARRVLESMRLKVKFSSPTMLRDPLRPAGKHKTLLPCSDKRVRHASVH